MTAEQIKKDFRKIGVETKVLVCDDIVKVFVVKDDTLFNNIKLGE